MSIELIRTTTEAALLSGRMQTRLLLALTCSAAFVLGSASSAQSPAETLAPTGTLRAVFLGQNPVQGRIDPQTGKALGPVPEIVEALARQIGRPFVIVSAPNAAGIVSALSNQTADIGFLAYDAARARDVDFGAPLLVMFNSYLVPAGSTIRRSADVDRAGVTVAAVRGQTQELFVSSHLKNAKIRLFEAMPPQAEVEALLAGKDKAVDAFAINRQRSIEAEAASGKRLRALADSFLEVDQSFVVRKGDAAKLPILERFAAEIRASGLIKASISRAALVGVDVARPGARRD
jgi:polar amino acid transport system substrate-binding protein